METVWKQSLQQLGCLAVMKYFLAVLPVAFSITLIRHFGIYLLLNLWAWILILGSQEKNAKALHVLPFIKFSLAIPEIDGMTVLLAVPWPCCRISKHFAKAGLGVESHLIMIQTNHKAVKQCVMLHSFLLVEPQLMWLPPLHIITLPILAKNLAVILTTHRYFPVV